MSDLSELLELAKTVARRAAAFVVETTSRQFVHTTDNPREVKALADRVLDEQILSALRPTRVPILSEESGFIGDAVSEYRFLVDPLDGTYNFVKNLGPAAISIALWRGEEPVFGVIFDLSTSHLAWGGRGIGAFREGAPLAVSATSERQFAAVCTGYPARIESTVGARESLLGVIDGFGKVRMLGSAAVSLLKVASGAADAYVEQCIMEWDVAAGLAIVQGAGGTIKCTPTPIEHAFDVRATNGHISLL